MAVDDELDDEEDLLVLDVDGKVENAVDILEEIRALPGTIRARLLNRV